MSRDSLDPDVLAALLDGKLSGGERDRALAQLARSPHAYELFVEAARTLQDFEGAESGPAAPENIVEFPAQRARPRRWAPILGLMAAASLAALLVIPRYTRDATNPRGLLDGAMLVTPSASTLESALGPEWFSPGWSVMRGEAAMLSADERAFRIGVRLADVDAAHEAIDTAALRIARADLIELLRGFEASGPLVSLFDRVPVRLSEAELNDSARALHDFVASPRYTLGVLLEQARLASIAGRSELFDRSYTQMLQRAASDAALSTNAQTELDRLLDAIDDGAPALPLVQQQSVTLISMLGG